MSILNGNINSDIIHKEKSPFGNMLEESAFLDLDGLVDIKVSKCGKYAFAACRHYFYIFDISNINNITVVSKTGGISQARQLYIMDDCVYITMRENGLVAIDIKNYDAPQIKWYYDTLELATGIFASDGYVYVTNRHIGVEIVDVKGDKPVFLSSFYCGEAQSVFVENNIAYIGDWMNRMVRLFDVSEKKCPKEISRFNVDGYADGIYVKDGLCYVATGHHSATLKNRMKYLMYDYVTADMISEGYGAGHGLEIFDVSRPYSCEYISRVKFPPLFFGKNDTWRVTVSDNYAYVCDTYNGLFVLDIGDPYNPQIISHYHPKEISECADYPTVQRLYKPLCAVDLANGYIFAAGHEDGLHIIEYPLAKSTVLPQNGTVVHPTAKAKRVFLCNSQIHSFCSFNDCIALACGNDGIYVLDKNYNAVCCYKTEYAVRDICTVNGKLCAAEGLGGLAVYKFDNGKLMPEDRLVIDNGESSVNECAAFGNKIVIHINSNVVGIAQIKDNKLTLIKTERAGGILYKRNICKYAAKNYVCIKSLSYCMALYDINSLNYVFKKDDVESCPIEDGVSVKDGKCIVIHRNKYACADPDDIKGGTGLVYRKVTNAYLNGSPFVCGDYLFLLNACTKTVEILDITDVNNPAFVTRIDFDGTLEFADVHDNRFLVCSGHSGLFEIAL